MIFLYASIKLPLENQKLYTWTFLNKNYEHSRARNQIVVDVDKKV